MTTAKIKIAARLRPQIPGEIDDHSVKVCHGWDEAGSSTSGSGGSLVSVPNPRDPTQVFKFPFSSCYDQSSTQEEIFQRDVQPMIDVVFTGVTVTIFAYGVTSSGKTHTMQGTRTDPGIIPRTIQAMFERKDKVQNYDVSLAMSYMEIYKDEVYDLLVDRETAPKLPVRENDAGMVFVANLTSTPIASVDDFDAFYSQANRQRSVGATNLNHASSRSHAVLTMDVKMVHPTDNRLLLGKINLVDLAGSENNKLTGNDSSRMAESAAINKSLSVLGQVVHALNQGAPRIPYRNSKLTRILQDALGGSSVGLLICNLAPGVKFRQDTLNTLNFAVRTKNIENKPVINERDNRPAPKLHFAAIQPPAPKLVPAFLPPTATAVHLPANKPGPRHGRRRSRHSLVPIAKVPRGFSHGAPTFVLPVLNAVREQDEPSNQGSGLSEKDIDERISKAVEAAVEAEVARRLEERERARQREEEERRAKRVDEMDWKPSHGSPEKPRSSRKEQTLPPGILTPLLKRHQDLDDQLQARLSELERKLERSTKEEQLAEVLSPHSRRKTGRAYVALARSHTEKGDLQVALDLYRKAESYVPDNIKLKERIIDIEWAVKNNKEFIPSPRKVKRKQGSRLLDSIQDENFSADQEDSSRSSGKGDFGDELTNTENIACLSPYKKRPFFFGLNTVNEESPMKKRRKSTPDDEHDVIRLPGTYE